MPEETPREEQQQVSVLWTGLQTLAVFILVQVVLKSFKGGTPSSSSTPANPDQPVVAQVPAPSTIPKFSERPPQSPELLGSINPIPQWIAPVFPLDSSVDMSIYVSPTLRPQSLKSFPPKALVLEEKNYRIGDYQDTRQIHTSFPVPKQVQNNGTLWAHFYIAQSGSPLDPTSSSYDHSKAYHFVKPLNQFHKKKKVKKSRNLLSDLPEPVQEDDIVNDQGVPISASYYHPNFTLSFIPDSGSLSYIQSHPAVRDWIHLEATGARDASGQNGWYYPILFVNSFWQLRSHMTEINNTVTELPLNIQLNSLANWKFTLTTTMDFGMKQQAEKISSGQKLTGGGDGSELEEVKRILLDSNIYLLCTTIIVGLLHTIFEMLAFKNDVTHWRTKKDNVGVSVRTILANVFMQTIIFLYLMDNNENTSWMILFGQGIGIVIEAWKITKTVDVRIRPTPPDSTSIPWKFLPYTIVFEDKHQLSENEIKTQEYDQIAFRYMYWVGVPLLIAYAIYSLVYDTHKSWYSFTITTLVGSVYAYGFLLMVPSLYINYRLKSVAHMPGKAMTYKVLGTFVDDLFAFTIKMPLLHRLATFRDDIIFFIYVYQRWNYKIDYARVNEFGQGGEDEQGKVAEKKDLPADESVDIDSSKDATATDDTAIKASGRDEEVATKRK